MIGIPKVLKTYIDYENCHNKTKNKECHPETMIRAWEGLLKTKKYIFDRILTDGEEPDGTEPEYVVITDDNERRQYKLVDNTDAKIYQLGYTTAEVQNKIDELEAL